MLASPIGHYQPGASLMHLLDARAKTICLMALVILMITVTTPAGLVLAISGLVVLVAASHVAPKIIWASVRPTTPFVTIVAVFNLFMAHGGVTLAQLGPLELTTGGIWIAALYAIRLLMAVALGALLLLTTTPTALTDAFESLLSPLGRLGLPAHEISMVLSLALRFVPVLADEAQSIMDAQAARGASFEEGGLANRVRAIGAILVPMFAGAIRHADNLSRALDARCYEGGAGRTHYHEQRIRPRDIAFAAACVLWSVCLIALSALGI